MQGSRHFMIYISLSSENAGVTESSPVIIMDVSFFLFSFSFSSWFFKFLTFFDGFFSEFIHSQFADLRQTIPGVVDKIFEMLTCWSCITVGHLTESPCLIRNLTDPVARRSRQHSLVKVHHWLNFGAPSLRDRLLPSTRWVRILLSVATKHSITAVDLLAWSIKISTCHALLGTWRDCAGADWDQQAC